MLQHHLRPYALLAVITSTVLSCISVANTLDSSWLPEIYFKNAQEAMDDNRYQDAIFYYEVFLVRYPESIERRIAAEYEMAFIHYKIGKHKIAEARFSAILQKYEESPYAMLFPPRFRQLSEIGLKNIRKSAAVNNRVFWRMSEQKWADDHGEELTEATEKRPE